MIYFAWKSNAEM